MSAVASGLFMVVLWATGMQPKPKVDKGFMLALMPVALFHTIGHVSACVSFSQVRPRCLACTVQEGRCACSTLIAKLWLLCTNTK